MSASCSPFTGALSTSQQSCEGNARHIVVKAPSDQVAVPSANESSPVHKVPQIQEQSSHQVAQSQALVSPVVPQTLDGVYTHSPHGTRLDTTTHRKQHIAKVDYREGAVAVRWTFWVAPALLLFASKNSCRCRVLRGTCQSLHVDITKTKSTVVLHTLQRMGCLGGHRGRW